MRRTLIENVIRDITHRVVRDLCEAASLEASDERPMMSGERFDEILRDNGIDGDGIIYMLGLDWDDFYEVDDEYDVNLTLDYDGLVEWLWSNDDFINFISGLDTIPEEEKTLILDGDVDTDNSEILKSAYDDSVRDFREAAEEDARDSYLYNKDPYSYYGVRRSDFI